MIHANQNVIAQSTNVSLTGLRSAEISYFASFYGIFGTQSALIGGLIITGITQVPGLDTNSGCAQFWLYMYWISSAIAFCASMHVLICTAFISVYGQGFALRGPAGSMAKAVEGMVVEQDQIVTAFIISVIAVAISTSGIFWIMANQTGAIIATVFIFITMFEWLRYILRIYNRFKFSRETEEMRFDDGNTRLEYHLKPKTDIISDPTERKPDGLNDQKKSLVSKFGSMFKSKDDDFNKTSQDVQNPVHSSSKKSLSNEFEFSGYLTVKIGKESIFGKDPWKRQYVAIKRSKLYYYESKSAFESKPDEPINRRQLDLEGQTLEVKNQEPPFLLILTGYDEDEGDRKPTEFRCDTLTETTQWIEALNKGIKLASSYKLQAIETKPSSSNSTGNGNSDYSPPQSSSASVKSLVIK